MYTEDDVIDLETQAMEEEGAKFGFTLDAIVEDKESLLVPGRRTSRMEDELHISSKISSKEAQSHPA